MIQTNAINDSKRIFDDAIYTIVDAIKFDGNNGLKNRLIKNDKFRNHYLFEVYDSKWESGKIMELDFMIHFTLKDDMWNGLIEASKELKSRLKSLGRLTYNEI